MKVLFVDDSKRLDSFEGLALKGKTPLSEEIPGMESGNSLEGCCGICQRIIVSMPPLQMF
jgi:hypothetical protein